MEYSLYPIYIPHIYSKYIPYVYLQIIEGIICELFFQLQYISHDIT